MSEGLTKQERAILDHLAAAWNNFIELPGKHPDDDAEMRHAIHAAQMLIAYRVAKRIDPDTWTKTE